MIIIILTSSAEKFWAQSKTDKVVLMFAQSIGSESG